MELSTAFINRQTGEVFVVTDDELSMVEEGEEEAPDLPEWQQHGRGAVRLWYRRGRK